MAVAGNAVQQFEARIAAGGERLLIFADQHTMKSDLS